MELAFDEVNIADMTNSVLSTMSGLVKDKPIQMKRIIQPDLPTVRADAIRVRQVMINLLSNASKFTDEGDILVEVGLKPGPTGRNELRVSVTDTGRVSPNRIRQNFSRLSHKWTTRPPAKQAAQVLGFPSASTSSTCTEAASGLKVISAREAHSTSPCRSSARKKKANPHPAATK